MISTTIINMVILTRKMIQTTIIAAMTGAEKNDYSKIIISTEAPKVYGLQFSVYYIVSQV